jgi:hypothetical protein
VIDELFYFIKKQQFYSTFLPINSTIKTKTPKLTKKAIIGDKPREVNNVPHTTDTPPTVNA